MTDPENGTAEINGDTITYTPDARFAGEDVFDYTISDGRGGANTATVHITVRPSLAVGSDGSLYAVWADERQGPGSGIDNHNYAVYLDRSADGGLTWGADARVNDMAEVNEQAYASVAVGPEGVLVVRRDLRFDPHARLFHKLNP